MTELEKKIAQLEQEMAEAFNRKDLEQVLTFFDPGLIGFSSTTHERIRGLDALRRTFEYYLQEGERVEYRVSDVLVQDFGDVAVASFHWVVTIHGDDRVHEIPGRGTHVFQKKNGAWRIVHEHFSRAHHHE